MTQPVHPFQFLEDHLNAFSPKLSEQKTFVSVFLKKSPQTQERIKNILDEVDGLAQELFEYLRAFYELPVSEENIERFRELFTEKSTPITRKLKDEITRADKGEVPYGNESSTIRTQALTILKTVKQAHKIPPSSRKEASWQELRLREEQKLIQEKHENAFSSLLAGLNQLVHESKHSDKFTLKHPMVFMSYAWPSPHRKYEEWVQPFLETLYDHLRAAGVNPLLDRKDSRFGYSTYEHMAKIEGCDFMILFGTESIADKHNHKESKAIKTELNYARRMMGQERPIVIPILISGNIFESFPEDFRGYTAMESFIDPAQETQISYVKHFRELLERLFGVPQSGLARGEWDELWEGFKSENEDLFMGTTQEYVKTSHRSQTESDKRRRELANTSLRQHLKEKMALEQAKLDAQQRRLFPSLKDEILAAYSSSPQETDAFGYLKLENFELVLGETTLPGSALLTDKGLNQALITGSQGGGKTLLAHKLVREWQANPENWEAVFYVSGKEVVKLNNDTKLADVVLDCGLGFTLETDRLASFLNVYANNILLVIDDIDSIPKSHDTIRSALLKFPNWIATTKQASLENGSSIYRLRINSAALADLQKSVPAHLKRHPLLMPLMQNPMFLGKLATLKDRHTSTSAMTECLMSAYEQGIGMRRSSSSIAQQFSEDPMIQMLENIAWSMVNGQGAKPADEQLSALSDQLGWTTKNDQGQVAFTHEFLKTYFAAQKLKTLFITEAKNAKKHVEEMRLNPGCRWLFGIAYKLLAGHPKAKSELFDMLKPGWDLTGIKEINQLILMAEEEPSLLSEAYKKQIQDWCGYAFSTKLFATEVAETLFETLSLCPSVPDQLDLGSVIFAHHQSPLALLQKLNTIEHWLPLVSLKVLHKFLMGKIDHKKTPVREHAAEAIVLVAEQHPELFEKEIVEMVKNPKHAWIASKILSKVRSYDTAELKTALLKTLENDDPEVQIHGVKSIGYTYPHDSDVQDKLKEIPYSNAVPFAWIEALKSRARIADSKLAKEVLEALQDLLSHEDELGAAALEVAGILGSVIPKQVIPVIQEGLDSSEAIMQIAALRAITHLRPPPSDLRADVNDLLSDENTLVRLAAMKAVGCFPKTKAASIVKRLKKEKDSRVRLAACELLKRLPVTDRFAVEFLTKEALPLLDKWAPNSRKKDLDLLHRVLKAVYSCEGAHLNAEKQLCTFSPKTGNTEKIEVADIDHVRALFKAVHLLISDFSHSRIKSVQITDAGLELSMKGKGLDKLQKALTAGLSGDGITIKKQKATLVLTGEKSTLELLEIAFKLYE